jgi:DNA recombination protein RmuC
MLWLIICLQAITIITLLVLFFTRPSKTNESSLANLRDSLSRLDAKSDRTEQAIRSGIQELRVETASNSECGRDESSRSFRDLRAEILTGLTTIGTQLTTSLNEFRQCNAVGADTLRDTVVNQIDKFSKTLECFTKDGNAQQTALREALNTKLSLFQRDTAEMLKGVQGQLSEQGSQIKDAVTGTLTHLGAEVRDNTAQLTNEVKTRLEDVSKQVMMLSDTNEKKQEALRQAVEQRMDKLSENNSKKLEEMRQTVDEKLHSTLEKRLTESFGLVTDQLGKVQLGLGEMKDLAIGVGDLKRVLTNVKVRGGFAEVQLGMQLEQMLAPDQYLTNARIRPDSQETV